MTDSDNFLEVVYDITRQSAEFLDEGWRGTIEEALMTFYSIEALCGSLSAFDNMLYIAYDAKPYSLALVYLTPLLVSVSQKTTDTMIKKLGYDRSMEYLRRKHNFSSN